MPYPFTALPSLKALIDAATRQGCEEGAAGPIHGPRGEAQIRYLKRGKVVAILPNVSDEAKLNPSTITQLVRVLKLDGFEYCTIPEEEPFGGGEED